MTLAPIALGSGYDRKYYQTMFIARLFTLSKDKIHHKLYDSPYYPTYQLWVVKYLPYPISHTY